MGATVEPVCDRSSTFPGEVDVILTRDQPLEVLTDEWVKRETIGAR